MPASRIRPVALNTVRVDYLIFGGVAVDAHGLVRLTRDVDLVIGLSPGNAARGLHALRSIGYQMGVPEKPETLADAATHERRREEKNLIVLKLWSDAHRRTPTDVFVYEPFPFEAELALDRILDRRLTFLEKMERLEEAETLSLLFEANRQKRLADR